MKQRKEAKVQYAYRVRTYQFDKIEVERFVRISHDATTVTFMHRSGPYTELKKDVSHHWFGKYESAQAYAQQQIQARIATWTALIERMQDSLTQLEHGHFVDGNTN